MNQTELLTANQLNFRNKNEKTRNNGSKLSYNLFKIEFKTTDSIPKVIKIHDMPREPIVVPGSFKPVHEGHFLIGISACKEIYKNTSEIKPIIFELSKFNRNKPSISDGPVKARIKEFLTPKRDYLQTVRSKTTDPNFDSYTFYICITETAMFRDKIDIFGKGASFVIGADLFVRLISPPKEYSPGKPKNPIIACTEVLSDLIKFKANNCKFYVANRQQANKNIASKKGINVDSLNNKNSVGNFNKIIKGQLGVVNGYINKSSFNQKDAIIFLYQSLITDNTLFKKIDDFVNINMSSTMVRENTKYSNLNNKPYENNSKIPEFAS